MEIAAERPDWQSDLVIKHVRNTSAFLRLTSQEGVFHFPCGEKPPGTRPCEAIDFVHPAHGHAAVTVRR